MTRPTTARDADDQQAMENSYPPPSAAESGQRSAGQTGVGAEAPTAPQRYHPQAPPPQAAQPQGSYPHTSYPQAPSTQAGGFMPYPEYGQSQEQFGHQPRGSGPAGETSGVRVLWVLGFVLGAVGVLFPIAGIAGIACGAVAWGKRSSRGRTATIVAIVCTLIGLAIGIALAS